MPNLRDIRRRIRSVRNTAQITKAMQMVASSKMQKAQQAAINGRPFDLLAHKVMRHAAAGAIDYTHPLLEVREVRKRAVVVVGTDKGLCGALNSNLFREASRFDTATTQFVAAGKKAAQFLARTRRHLVAEYSYSDTPTYGQARAIAQAARKLFESREVDAVDILFTRFINTLSQRPEISPLLPLALDEPAPKHDPAGAEPTPPAPGPEYLFEPSPHEVMDILLHYQLDFHVAQILLEAKASEHSARMVAMKNATDNARQLVKALTLEYNKLRQANITKELLEISSAALSLA